MKATVNPITRTAKIVINDKNCENTTAGIALNKTDKFMMYISTMTSRCGSTFTKQKTLRKTYHLN